MTKLTKATIAAKIQENTGLSKYKAKKGLKAALSSIIRALGDGKKVDRSKINPQTILESAQRIVRLHKITYRYCDWWTAYQIGQRVGNSFSLRERVFGR